MKKILPLYFSIPLCTLAFSTLWWSLLHDDHYWLLTASNELKRMEVFMSYIPFSVPDIRALTETFTGLTIFPPSYEESQIEASLRGIGERLLEMQYLTSLGSMFQTAWTRIFLLLVLLAISSPFLVVAFWAGIQRRKIKYDNFENPHPSIFRLLLNGTLFFLLLVLNCVVLPWMMPSWVALAFVVCVAFLIWSLTANFHLF